MAKIFKLLKRLKAFPAAREGNFALWTAAALVPLAVVGGAATDLQRIETFRSALQSATDTAVLSAGRAYLAGDEGDARRLAAARSAAGAAFTANLDARYRQLLDVSWQVGHDPAGGGELVLTATGRAPLVFGGLLGMADAPVTATAASLVAARLEVALVLDTTGSMLSNNKLGILKTSTSKLIDELAAAGAQNPRRDPLKISLVPYSNTVRLPPAVQKQPWLDGWASGAEYWRGVARPAPGFNRFERYGPGGWEGCVESRPTPYDVQATVPRPGDPNTRYVPFWNPDNADPNAGCSISELVPMTAKTAHVKHAVKKMEAGGFTNIPMGLVWGWQTLLPGGLLGAGPEAPRPDLIKAVVLVTDGDNDLGDVGNNHYSGVGRMDQKRVGVDHQSTRDQRRRALDERLSRLCTAMKASGVVIYAVRVEVASGNDAALRNCASQPGAPYYHDVRDADQLPGVFAKVTEGLLELRLTR